MLQILICKFHLELVTHLRYVIQILATHLRYVIQIRQIVIVIANLGFHFDEIVSSLTYDRKRLLSTYVCKQRLNTKTDSMPLSTNSGFQQATISVS